MAFTHFDAAGNAWMVDVGEKPETAREATAAGVIKMSRECFDSVKSGRVGKGDVLGAARIAGIMGAKRTPELIPLCHTLNLTKLSVDFEMLEEACAIRALCTAKATGKTGVEIRPGDSVEAELPDPKRPFTAAVITLSDKGYSGERADESGPAAREMLEAAGYEIVETLLLPDEPEQLKAALRRLADQRRVELVVTSGGTGFSPRDRTPEATLAVADRNAPGIAEYIRMRSMAITPRAMLGRGVSVIRGGTLIVNLPGSPRAVRESLGFILDALPHGLEILRGTARECARKEGGSSK